MIGIIDYGMGNLKSIYKAMEFLGYEVKLVTRSEELAQVQGIILPGVGAFPGAMENLNRGGFVQAIRESVDTGTPFLGICLGMQLLFQWGYEGGEKCPGLAILPGEVTELQVELKVPHMGWNQLERVRQDHPLWNGLSEGANLYFVHSFALNQMTEDVIGTTDYGRKIPIAVARENVMGVQFHPEKSGQSGLQILRNFGGMVG